MQNKSITFDDLRDVTDPFPELESPAFLQGMLMGTLCGEGEIKESVWIKRLLNEAKVTSVKESFLVAMHQLYLDAEAMLNGSGFEMHLCLPGDSETLAFRAQMLGQLCEGFLYGLGLAGKPESKLTGEVAELCQDFGSIARIDITDLSDSSEQDESDFMELVEFVKIGIMTINETLNPIEGSPIMTMEPPTESRH